MFRPRYSITPALLERIKRITLLVYELNRRHVSEVALMQLEDEARAVSIYASTSIEGTSLPLTEVKRLMIKRPYGAFGVNGKALRTWSQFRNAHQF